jgi:hypothetical protein
LDELAEAFDLPHWASGAVLVTRATNANNATTAAIFFN